MGIGLVDGFLVDLAAVGTVVLEQLLAFKLQADGSQGVAGEALYAVHSDGKQCGSLEALGLGSGLHGDSSDDTAGEGGQTRNDEFLADDGDGDEPAAKAHAGQTGKAQDDGLPLLSKLLEGDDRAHVDEQQVNADGAAEGDQLRIADHRLGDDSPVTDQQDDRRDEHGGDPGLGQVGHSITDQIRSSANDECKCEIVHYVSSFFFSPFKWRSASLRPFNEYMQ